MAIDFDAVTSTGLFTGNTTTSHTPVGTPKGVLVLISQGDYSQDQISGVTYGGVTMTELTGSPAISTGEVGVVYAYFLGASVPTGTQDCVITTTASTSDKGAAIITLTGSADLEVQAVDLDIASLFTANPSGTIALDGQSCFVAIGFATGLANLSSAPLTGWGADVSPEWDFGQQSGGVFSYDTIGASDVTYGWTQVEDDATAIAVAIKEAASGGATTYTYSGSGSLTFSGTATTAEVKLYGYSASGSLTFSGTATTAETKLYGYSGTGTLTYSGAASTTLVPTGSTTYSYNGTGSVVFSGTATTAEIKLYSSLGSGSLVFSGAATTAYTPGLVSYSYLGSGSFVFSGAATTTGPSRRQGDGTITKQGIAGKKVAKVKSKEQLRLERIFGREEEPSELVARLLEPVIDIPADIKQQVKDKDSASKAKAIVAYAETYKETLKAIERKKVDQILVAYEESMQKRMILRQQEEELLLLMTF